MRAVTRPLMTIVTRRQPRQADGSGDGNARSSRNAPRQLPSRAAHRLTDAHIKAEKPRRAPFKLYDGRGLYLIVRPSGSRWWRYDYRVGGARKTMSLGTYPDVPLKRAREKLQDMRAVVADGVDPLEARRQHAGRPVTFRELAKEWWGKVSPALAETTRTKNRWLLEQHLVPALGSWRLAAIDAPTLLEALRPVEAAGKIQTAHRLKIMAGQIFRYAVATGRATGDPSVGLRGALAKATSESHAAITEPAKAGALLRAIDAMDANLSVRTALKLAPLVFVRPHVLRAMAWADVDFHLKVWRIPAVKMKMRDAHLVPLSTQAIALLKTMRAYTGKGTYVFPAYRTPTRPLSENTLNAALRRIGYDGSEMTAHGFRAMARTLLDEQLRYPPDVIEVQLGHAVRGPLGDTYNRAKYLEQRTQMMQAYADYLDQLKAETPDRARRSRRGASPTTGSRR